MHGNSITLLRDFVNRFLDRSTPTRIADVGSADVNGTYREYFDSPEWKYTGFDLQPGNNVDVVLASAEFWNLPQEHRGAFDVVVSGQVLEHVRKPWKWILDVASLCRPGGLIWISAPCVEVYHEHPVDCWRIYPDGMRALADEANLEVLTCYVNGNDTTGVLRKRPQSQQA
jgi:SAM-dependent methyltransferase